MARKNSPNVKPPRSPTSMFWGLPVSVSTEPELEAVASAIRYGAGRTPSGRSTSSSSGVSTRQIVSLTKSADSAPEVRTTAASSMRPIETTATAPSGEAAGRLNGTPGRRWNEIRTYAAAKIAARTSGRLSGLTPTRSTGSSCRHYTGRLGNPRAPSGQNPAMPELRFDVDVIPPYRSEEHTSELQSRE